MTKLLSLFTTYLDNAFIDFDGAYGDQCVDLVQQYNEAIVGGPRLVGEGAKDIWKTYPKSHYEAIPDGPKKVPQPGDIIIWGAKYGPYGHIAICISASADSDTFVAFSQNDPTASRAVVRTYTWDDTVLGWLHPIQHNPALDEYIPLLDGRIDKLMSAISTNQYYKDEPIRFYDDAVETAKKLKESQEQVRVQQVTIAEKSQEISNRKQQVTRLEAQLVDEKLRLEKQIEGLKSLIDESGSGIATYKDQIKILEARVDGEAKEKGIALNQIAALQTTVAQLREQIKQNARPDYVHMSLPDRLKYCIDIIFSP